MTTPEGFSGSLRRLNPPFSELTGLEVRLLAEDDSLHIQATVGALTDELRQAMTEQKAALRSMLQYGCGQYNNS